LLLEILLLLIFQKIQPEEEFTLVSLIEIPAPRKPLTKKPEITEKKPVAQLEVKPKAEPASPEPPKIQEKVTQTKVVKKEEVSEGTPRVEVKTPEVETISPGKSLSLLKQ